MAKGVGGKARRTGTMNKKTFSGKALIDPYQKCDSRGGFGNFFFEIERSKKEHNLCRLFHSTVDLHSQDQSWLTLYNGQICGAQN